MRWRGLGQIQGCLLALLVLGTLSPPVASAATFYPPRAPGASGLPLARTSASSEPIADPEAPGVAVNGVIFIKEEGGYGRCSGTSVNAPNLSLVITAGHCVFDEGEWSGRHWVFVPGYHHGERPFGTFTAHWLGTTPAWLARENLNFDVGMAVVGRNEKGQRLAAAVGGDGFATRLPLGQHFDVYGYPVERPFNGGTLQVCRDSAYEGHDLSSFVTPGPLELGVDCPISSGASGGGWAVEGDLINGVTSNSYNSDPDTDYGPYFGKAVAALFHRAGRVK